MVTTIDTLSLDDARILLAAAEAKADEVEVPSNIAVADAGGNLLAFSQMDGGWFGSIDIGVAERGAAMSQCYGVPIASGG